MESKKINQLATSVNPQTSDLTIIGDPITGVSKKISLLQIANLFATTGTVSSVAVTETGDALTITGSPITSTGTINIAFAGAANQYVRGDGALADFPTSTGGGSSVSYYLNSSVSQGTIGGVAYREFSKDPIAGAGTDITATTNGYIASYITDANDPALLEVPAGNFNCEFYFSVNSDAHNPYVYAEIYKYDGSTFTLIGSSQSVPEYLTNGTTLSPYYFAIPVTQTVLTLTDRIAIRIYANVDTREVTLHTENNHLCQVVTTFSKGLTSLNNLTRQVQFLATGTSGTDFNIVSSGDTHTFNIPSASASNRGLVTTGAQTIAGAKVFDNPITANSGIGFLNGVMPNITSNLYTGIGGNSEGISIITRPVSTNYTNNLYFGLNNNSYTFPDATGTIALTSDLSAYVTLGTSQTISGQKTFTVQTNFAAKINATNNQGIGFYNVGSTLETTLYPSIGLSANRTIYLPNASGTIALTSDIPSNIITGTGTRAIYYIPVFSGSANTIENSIIQQVSSNIGIGVSPSFKLDVNGTGRFTGVLTLDSTISNGTYTYTLPSATGTLALTSNLSAYLPLTGGTLTGNLTIAKSDTLNVLTLSSTNTNVISFITSSVQKGEISVNASNFQFNSATTNGYIFKNSAANNVLTITDAGVTTLTGALSGTSATFSGNLTIQKTAPNILMKGGYAQDLAFFLNNEPSVYIVDDATATKGIKINISTGAFTQMGSGAATFSSNLAVGGSTDDTSGGLYSNIALNGSTYSRYSLLTGGTSRARFQFDGTNTTLTTTSTGGKLQLATFGAAAMEFVTNDTLRMTITSGGNVGIGTSSPQRTLSIANGGPTVEIDPNGGAAGPIYFNYNRSTATYLTPEYWGLAHKFMVNGGNEAMRITSSGRVGIGTSNPADKLHVSNGGAEGLEVGFNTNQVTMIAYNRSTSAYIPLILQGGGGDVFIGATSTINSEKLYVKQSSSSNLTGIAVGYGSSGGQFRSISIISTNVMTFNNGINEATLTSAGVWTDASDISIKKDIENIQYGLTEVMALQPRKYKMKSDDLSQIGFIAQEVEDILPELITTSDNNMKGLSYGQLTAVLVKAIQEQQAQIEELKAMIAAK